MTPDTERAGRAERRQRFGSIEDISGAQDPKRCRRFALRPHSKLLASVICSLLFLIGFASAPATTAGQKRAGSSRVQKPKILPKPKIDYGKFSHTTHVVTQK